MKVFRVSGESGLRCNLKKSSPFFVIQMAEHFEEGTSLASGSTLLIPAKECATKEAESSTNWLLLIRRLCSRRGSHGFCVG